MSGTRRELLKYFGIGTVIVPMVSGAPDVTTPAKLIATPELRPVILTEGKPLDLRAVKSVTITVECIDGTRRSIQANAYGTGTLRVTDSIGLDIAIFGQSSPRSQVGTIWGDGWLT